MAASACARLQCRDVTGRCVAILADLVMEPGVHEARWTDPASPGVYFARLREMGETRRLRAVVTC